MRMFTACILVASCHDSHVLCNGSEVRFSRWDLDHNSPQRAFDQARHTSWLYFTTLSQEISTPSLIRAEGIAVNDPVSAQNTSLECKENDNNDNDDNDDNVVPFVAVVVATDIASEANTPIP